MTAEGDERVAIPRATLAAAGMGLVAMGIVAALAVDHAFHDHGHREHGGTRDGHTEHAEHDEHRPRRVRLSPEARQNARLELRKAGPSRITVTLELPGELTLNADGTAHVTPRVAGTVREVKGNLGDRVKKGDVLAVLDSRDLAEMQRQMLATKERLTLAEGEFRRQEALFNEKIGAEREFLAAKQALAEARIEHKSASQKLAAAAGSGSRGAGYALLAPIDGTIIEKHANIGEVMKEDTQAFVVADLSRVWVEVTVYARDLPRVAVGQRARVRAEGIERPAEGIITYMGSTVGEQTRSARARIVLDDPGPAWRPGLFVSADVAVDQADVRVAVEDEAIQRIGDEAVVFVETGEGFEPRRVLVGRGGVSAEGGSAMVEVTGVHAGETYVAKNSFLLKAELGKAEAGHGH